MDSNSNFNQLETPLPQKNADYKIDIQMSKKDKYIEINVESNVKKYNNELCSDDFVTLNKNFKNAKHLKNIYEALQFSIQKGKFQIIKIGNALLQITFNTNYGVCNIQLNEVNNDPRPPLNNNFNNNNTNTAQPNDSNPNENKKVENQIELIKKEYEKNLENIKKEHKNEIAKIEKNYYEAIEEMKNEFANVLNSIRNSFKNEMEAFKEQQKKNAQSNLIQVNKNNNSNISPGNSNIDPNIINTINSLTNEVNELKKKFALLDSIPNKKDFDLIKSWINPEKNMHFELIYSLKENGDDAANFHSICDHEKNTLTVLEIEGGKKIGGYTTLDWSGNGENRTDKETFIIDLSNKKKFPKINNKRSIFCLENRGPCFGQACDLGIFNPMNKGWSNKNGTFIINQEISDGKDNFEISDLEIYKVVFE